MRYALSLPLLRSFPASGAVVIFALFAAPAPFCDAVDPVDCDGDGVTDLPDGFPGAGDDSNANGIPDVCERDCNRNGVADAIEVASGSGSDCDGNVLLDACDLSPRPAFLEAVPVVELQQRRRDLALADVDGDGDLDLVLAVEFQIAVVRNEGARRFAAPEWHLISSNPRFVAAADMDGNGAVDLVTANSLESPLFDNVSVLLNDGESFAAPRSFVAGQRPVAMAVEDFVGNGAPDVAVLSRRSQDLAILPNAGDGRLGVAQRVQFDDSPLALNTGDFDADGVLDVVVSFSRGPLVLLLNEGDGEFTRETLPCPALPIATGDLDADGRPDIVARCSGFGDALRVLWNREGGFVPGVFANEDGFSPRTLALTDMDGDSDLDLVAGSTRRVGLFYNSGGGLLDHGWWREIPTSAADDLKPADLDGDGMQDLPMSSLSAGGTRLEVVFGGSAARAPDCNANGVPDACDIESGATADCDGNGVPDDCEIVENDCNANGTLDRCEVTAGTVSDCDENGIPDECDIREHDCNGNGQPDACDFTSRLEMLEPELTVLEHRVRRMRSADLDGDGDEDAVTVSDTPGHVNVLLNRGDGSFDVRPSVRTGTTPAALELADVDGDGNQDAIIGTRFSGALLLLGDGRGTLSSPRVIDDVDAEELTVGDFNGDGWPDIAVLEEQPEMFVHDLLVLENDGSARFSRLPGIPHSCCPALLLSADLEGDGDVDIVAASRGGCLQSCAGLSYAVFVNRGKGQFEKIDVPGLVPHIITVFLIDLDLDGRLDMATGERIYFSTSTGFFNRSLRLGGDLVMIGAADFDGDGFGELVRSRFFGTPAIIVHWNLRDQSFGIGLEIPADANVRSAVTADFDGDGDKDLLVGGHSIPHDPARALYFLRNESAPPMSVDINQNATPDECEAAFHRGDPNADGGTDVADAIFLLEFLFAGRHAVSCRETADFFNDGRVNMADAIAILNYLFAGGQPPAVPGSTELPCGVDPDAVGSARDLGCGSYDACRV